MFQTNAYLETLPVLSPISSRALIDISVAMYAFRPQVLLDGAHCVVFIYAPRSRCR